VGEPDLRGWTDGGDLRPVASAGQSLPRRPGEWNTYDIVFEAPRFAGDQVTRPAFVTVFYNGVVVHNHKEIMGHGLP